MFDCLALVAAICLNETAMIEVDRSGGGTSAVIDIRRGRIVSQISSDNLLIADREKMFEYCSRECFHYSQKCDIIERRYVCDIYYIEKGKSYVKILTISGPGEAVVNEIKGAIKLCVGGDCQKLSAFEVEPRGAFPPTTGR